MTDIKMTVTDSALFKIIKELDAFSKDLKRNYAQTDEFLKMLHQLGWQDEVYNSFNDVTRRFNAHFLPLSIVMARYRERKEQELQYLVRYDALNTYF